jgi:hypothetical protein
MHPAIPTPHGGTQFRSRLEARWAVFFDFLGWRWEYEPFDARGYIPDFLIQGDAPLLLEVKPAATWAEYVQHIDRLGPALEGCWDHDILILGASALPFPTDDDTFNPYAGVLGESWPNVEHGGWAWGEARWAHCLACGEVAVYHADNSWKCRPCGHYDGDHYLGNIRYDVLQQGWREAGNVVQWKAKGVKHG